MSDAFKQALAQLDEMMDKHFDETVGARKCGLDPAPITQADTALDFAQANWMKMSRRVQELEALLEEKDIKIFELQKENTEWLLQALRDRDR